MDKLEPMDDISEFDGDAEFDAEERAKLRQLLNWLPRIQPVVDNCIEKCKDLDVKIGIADSERTANKAELKTDHSKLELLITSLGTAQEELAKYVTELQSEGDGGFTAVKTKLVGVSSELEKLITDFQDFRDNEALCKPLYSDDNFVVLSQKVASMHLELRMLQGLEVSDQIKALLPGSDIVQTRSTSATNAGASSSQMKTDIEQQSDLPNNSNRNVVADFSGSVGAVLDENSHSPREPAPSISGRNDTELVNPTRTSPLFHKKHSIDFRAPLCSSLMNNFQTPTDYVRKMMKCPELFAGPNPKKPGHRTCFEWLAKFDNFVVLQGVTLSEATLLLMNTLDGDAAAFLRSLEDDVVQSYYKMTDALLNYYDYLHDDRAKRKVVDDIIQEDGEKFETFVMRLCNAAYDIFDRNNKELIEEAVRGRVMLKAHPRIQAYICDQESERSGVITVNEMVCRVRSFEVAQNSKNSIYNSSNQNQKGQSYRGRDQGKFRSFRGGYQGQRGGHINNDQQSDSDSQQTPLKQVFPKKEMLCNNCGRNNHNTDNCWKNLSREQRQAKVDAQKNITQMYNQGKRGGDPGNGRVQPVNLGGSLDGFLMVQQKRPCRRKRKQKGKIANSSKYDPIKQEAVIDLPNKRFLTKIPDLDLLALRKDYPKHKVTQALLRNTPHVEAVLERFKCTCLIDTGAVSSLISDKLFQRILETKDDDWIFNNVINVKVDLAGYSNELIRITEAVKVQLNFGGKHKSAIFLVDRKSTSDRPVIGWSTLTDFFGNFLPPGLDLVTGIEGLDETNKCFVPDIDLRSADGSTQTGSVFAKESSVPLRDVLHKVTNVVDVAAGPRFSDGVNCDLAGDIRVDPMSLKILSCQIPLNQIACLHSTFSSSGSNPVLLESSSPLCQFDAELVDVDDKGRVEVVVDNRLEVDVHSSEETLGSEHSISTEYTLSEVIEQMRDERQDEWSPSICCKDCFEAAKAVKYTVSICTPTDLDLDTVTDSVVIGRMEWTSVLIDNKFSDVTFSSDTSINEVISDSFDPVEMYKIGLGPEHEEFVFNQVISDSFDPVEFYKVDLGPEYEEFGFQCFSYFDFKSHSGLKDRTRSRDRSFLKDRGSKTDCGSNDRLPSMDRLPALKGKCSSGSRDQCQAGPSITIGYDNAMVVNDAFGH